MTGHHVKPEVHMSTPSSINIEPEGWVYTTLTIVTYINYNYYD